MSGANVSTYHQLIATDGNTPQDLLTAGRRLMRGGRPLKAVAHFGRVLALDPGNQRAHAWRGHCLYELGRWDEALARLDRALAIDPYDEDALADRAITLRDLGRHEEALRDFGHALLRDGANVWCYVNRAETHRRLGRYEMGPADVDRALGGFGDWWTGGWELTVRARIHRQAGHHAEAEADHRRAVATVGTGCWVPHEYGVTLSRLGRADEARAQWTEAARVASAYAVRGRHFEMEGRTQLIVTLCALDRRIAAVNRTGSFLAAAPTHHEVRRALGDLDTLAAEVPVYPGTLAAVRGLLRPAADPAPPGRTAHRRP